MSTSAPEQGDQPQDPQATPEQVAVPATPPAPANPGPWANDLNALFQDEATRGQVDQFLREKVQPYTTKLEQQTAQSQDATRLWQDLSEKPLDTYVALTEEMFGAEVAGQLLTQIQQNLEQQQAPQEPGQPAPPQDPRVEQALQYIEQQQTAQYYQSQIERIAADPQYEDVDTNLLHQFVAAADGDFDQAVNLYRETAAGFQAKFVPPTETPAETPPPVFGSDTATPAQVPTEAKNPTMAEAIDDFMRENRANREAPPVA